jgi:pimeloyl-ACP methyl ester carboxylesterase
MRTTPRASSIRWVPVVTVALAGALGAGSLFVVTAAAQSRPDSARPTVVLVHGAWADGAGWNGVIKRLEHDGYPVIAPGNPLRSVSSDAAYIASVLDTIPGPVLLVGHSYGGMVTSNAAALTKNATNIRALVYIAAFIPETGESALQLVGHTPPSTPGASHIVPPGTPGVPANLTVRPFPPFGATDADAYIDADAFSDIFAGDVPAAQQQLMIATQRPLSFVAFTEPSAGAAWKTIPSWSLVAMQDNAIGTGNTRFMAQRTVTEGKGHVSEITSSHVVLISHPDAVEDVIRTADRSTR